MAHRTEPRQTTLHSTHCTSSDLVCVMIDLDTASAWYEGYCRRMQHCGCDSDIVKDEMHERASVLPGLCTSISATDHHAFTLVL